MEPLKPLGPLLDQDAVFLQAIIKMTCPRVVLEFGHLFGDSARAMLEALPSDAVLHSYDCDRESKIKDPRFHFHKVSQEQFEPVENVDLVFLDASHDLELNKKTFTKLIPLLTEKAIIAVHDTGTWPFNAWADTYNLGQETSDGRYACCPDEIRFMNWLEQHHPDFQQIHFHGQKEIRHGITLLQKFVTLTL